ncbi:MAG TPA: lipopolysaccharide kinase InaA family protein [Verrucomicrobiae bacterium]|nr:lipopolysaccharide kinase InaA family protein [Verrucomicrobiae bacterium]
MTRLKRDGIRWELTPECGPLLASLLAQAGRVIKESPAKRVSAHDVAGRTYYVKRYRHDAVALRSLKYLFKTPPARREWRLARRLEALGVPVVRHVAHGERWSWLGLRESILITEGFDGRPLDEMPDIPAAAVMEFVVFLHERGVLHEDLHPGNILARAEPLEFRLLDLDKTKLRSVVSPAEREDNLAFLGISLSLPLSGRAAERRVELRRRLLFERSRRCLRHNREFAPRHFGGLRWRVRLPLLTPGAERVMADPEEFLRSRSIPLKRGNTATIGVADGLVLKRFNLRKALNLAKDLFRPSRPARAFRKSYHLELVGVPTARVVGVAERRVLGLLVRSYQLMEEIPNAVTLRKLMRNGGAPTREQTHAAARLVARLHEEGFVHGDLNERNLMLDGDGRLYLIDLDALEFLGIVPAARAAEDLSRLSQDLAKHAAISRPQREIFLLHYCRARRLKRVPRTAD